MIPKIIHCCWFGGREKPGNIQMCMDSWRRVMPDYRVMEWNESNFDIQAIPFAAQAYGAKKFAFVSDVARVKALTEVGGIYLDTDVMVYRPFDTILHHPCVLGFEQGNYVATSFMASESGHALMRQFLEAYQDLNFIQNDGAMISHTNVAILTQMLCDLGLIRDNRLQIIGDGIAIYPQEYFSPYDYCNCIHQNTANTMCEHLFYVSWLPWSVRVKKSLKRLLVASLGKRSLEIVRAIGKELRCHG